MSGVETAVVRAVSSSIKPAMMLWRWWRPNTNKAAIAALADELGASVRREEQRLLDQLRAGPASFMHVEFTAAVQSHHEGVIESAEVSEIATYFDLLPKPKRLVVLGEPGSGKTVASAHLVLGLLEARRELSDARRAEEPVPVRVNAAGWDGAEDFSGWLTTRLGYDYRLRPPLTRALIDVGLILPVLDGLDEMDTEDADGSRARAVLDRLNETPWNNRPVVVVCRSSEFEELTRLGQDNGLHAATTIALSPFTPEQIETYLSTCQKRIGATTLAWDTVTNCIIDQPDGALAGALETPWMLGLAATALHHDPDTADQLAGCPDTEAVRDLLFAAQIPAAIAGTTRTGSFRGYTSDNVRTWMLALARCLEHRRATGRNGIAIRLDEIWEVAGTRCRVLHALAVGVVVAIMLGLGSGLMPAPFALTTRLELGLISGPVVGLGIGVAVWCHSFPRAVRLARRVPTRSRWRRALLVGLPSGLMVGLGLGVAVWFVSGLTGALMVGSLAGLSAWLVASLVAGLGADVKDELSLAVDERRLIRDDMRAAAFNGTLLGLELGLMVGLLVGLGSGLMVGFMTGLMAGLAVAVMAGLAFGLVSGRYFVAVCVFRFTAAFPARPGLFLDWARRSGLLRVTGTAYQFRHETFRQWLQQPRVDEEPLDHERPAVLS